MESIKSQNDEIQKSQQEFNRLKPYSSNSKAKTKLTTEEKKKRDQYLIDHKEEILKLEHKGRVKKVAELLKQDLNLDVNYKTLRRLINNYVIKGITNQNTEARRKRDLYLIEHKEEILKLEHKDRVKKVAEMIKQDLNLNVSYKTLYSLLNKYVLIDTYKKNTEEKKLRDKYLIDHREEIEKLDYNNRLKKVQELIKRDLNLEFNYNKLYTALTKFNLL